MTVANRRITFASILALFGIVYIALFFFKGQTFFQVPNSWFVTWMANIFQHMDQSGFLNVWSGQTQGTHYLYFLTWKPAQLLAGSRPYFALTFSLLWLVFSVGSVFLSAWLFYRIAREVADEARATVLGAFFFLVFLVVPDWYAFIDSMAIAGMLAAIYLLLRGRGTASGIALGISAAIKPMGLLLLPVLLKSEFLPRGKRLQVAGAALVSFLALLLPFAVGNYHIFMSSFRWQSGRPPWESVYALAGWLFNLSYPSSEVFRDYSGALPSDWGWTGVTPSSSVMTTVVPAHGQWYSTLFAGIMIACVASFMLRKRVDDREQFLKGSLCLLALYFGVFYGWSVQFLLWLVPFMLLLLPARATLGLCAVSLLEYPLLYALYMAKAAPGLVAAAPGLTVSMTAALAPAGAVGYWVAILLRTGGLLAVGFTAWVALPADARAKGLLARLTARPRELAADWMHAGWQRIERGS